MGKNLSGIPTAINGWVVGAALPLVYLFPVIIFVYIIPFRDRISRMQVMMTAPKNSHKPTGFLFCPAAGSDR